VAIRIRSKGELLFYSVACESMACGFNNNQTFKSKPVHLHNYLNQLLKFSNFITSIIMINNICRIFGYVLFRSIQICSPVLCCFDVLVLFVFIVIAWLISQLLSLERELKKQQQNRLMLPKGLFAFRV